MKLSEPELTAALHVLLSESVDLANLFIEFLFAGVRDSAERIPNARELTIHHQYRLPRAGIADLVLESREEGIFVVVEAKIEDLEKPRQIGKYCEAAKRMGYIPEQIHGFMLVHREEDHERSSAHFRSQVTWAEWHDFLQKKESYLASDDRMAALKFRQLLKKNGLHQPYSSASSPTPRPKAKKNRPLPAVSEEIYRKLLDRIIPDRVSSEFSEPRRNALQLRLGRKNWDLSFTDHRKHCLVVIAATHPTIIETFPYCFLYQVLFYDKDALMDFEYAKSRFPDWAKTCEERGMHIWRAPDGSGWGNRIRIDSGFPPDELPRKYSYAETDETQRIQDAAKRHWGESKALDAAAEEIRELLKMIDRWPK